MAASRSPGRHLKEGAHRPEGEVTRMAEMVIVYSATG